MTVSQAPENLWRALLGLALRERRRLLQRTLAEVAARAGVSVQYLSEVERGLKDPSSEIIAALVGALGLTLVDLTRRVGELAEVEQQVTLRSSGGLAPISPAAQVHFTLAA